MCRAPVGDGAKRSLRSDTRPCFQSRAADRLPTMWIGAHVSTAGGLANAIGRGEERGCESIQIFHQSPRMWRPTSYGEADFDEFNEKMAASKSVEAVIIHAV